MEQQVPQFLNVQPKVAGPFNFKQLLFIAGFGLIILIFFTTLSLPVFITVAIPLAGIALFLAFGKIKGFPAPTVLARSFGFLFASKIYVWKKKEGQGIIPSFEKKEAVVAKKIERPQAQLKTGQGSSLKGLNNMLELRK